MINCTYSKFKDDEPLKTVNRIRNILSEFGLVTTEDWSDNSSTVFFTNRIKINLNNKIGTNGKGTTIEYTLASGYGELMERLQNHALFNMHNFCLKFSDFNFVPDEKSISKEKLENFDNKFFNKYFIQIIKNSYKGYDFSKFKTLKEYIDFYYDIHKGKDEDFYFIPFYNVNTREVEYIPEIVYINGSNGLAAGNTKEEAIVQGMSEIFERYCNFEIEQNKYNLPDIPFDEYKNYKEILDLIQYFSDRNCDIKIKDASLGKGFPVIMVLFCDRKTGLTVGKTGCHPSFPIAIERCLTEALQSNVLSNFGEYIFYKILKNKFDYIYYALVRSEMFFSNDIFTKTPEWEYDRSFKERSFSSNKDMLKYMIKICNDNNFNLYVRDSSFLGFPSVKLYLPNVIEMRENYQNLIHKRLASPDFCSKCLDEKNNELIYNDIKFLYSNCDIQVLQPMIENLSNELLGIVFAYRMKKYNEIPGYIDMFVRNFRGKKNEKILDKVFLLQQSISENNFQLADYYEQQLEEYCFKFVPEQNEKSYDKRQIVDEEYENKFGDISKRIFEKEKANILNQKNLDLVFDF